MIRVGPSGWSHPRLVDVWPLTRGGGFDPLAFLGGYFGCVEVDATAHVIPRREHVARWKAALADAPRTRLVMRLPAAVTDLARDRAGRLADAEQVAAALADLLRRERLGALVARIDPRAIHGAREVRALAELARVLRGAPLVLEAEHSSWYAMGALDAVAGAGWSLAHVEPADRWDAPPRDHRPTGPVGMLRLLAPGQAPPPVIGALARRASALHRDVDDVFVVCAGPVGDRPALRLAAALELKYVLTGERPVRAWPEVVRACPHLEPLTTTE